MKHILGITVFLFILPLSAIDFVPGAQYQYTGASASSMALGGHLSTADAGTMSLLDNPALNALILRKHFQVGYGFPPAGTQSFYAIYSHPSKIGVFNAAYRFQDSESTAKLDLGSLQWMQAGFSKEISTQFLFGFSFNYEMYSSENFGEEDTGVYLNGALIYRENQTIDSTWGFGNAQYALLARQIGVFARYETENSEGERGFIRVPETRAGASFQFYNGQVKDHSLKARASLEAGLSLPFNFLFNSGLKVDYLIHYKSLENLGLRAGYLLAQEDIGLSKVGPYSLGLSMRFNIKITDLYVNYAMLPQQLSDGSSTYHQVDFSVAIGQRDEEAPQIDVSDIFADPAL